MAIALSHGGQTMYSSKAPSSDVLVGTVNGIVTLERRDGGWTAGRRVLEGKHVHAILIEPKSGAIFAGTLDGIHVSKDGGKSWTPKNEGLSQKAVYSIAAVEVDGRTRLYAGTEPAHLFSSEDLGEYWREHPALRKVPSVDQWGFPAPPHAGHVKNIVAHPKDPRVIFAGVEQGGLLKSADGGESWSELCLFEEAAGDVHRVVIDPTDPNRLSVNTGSGLYQSGDAGKTWKRITDRESEVGGYPDGLVVHPKQPSLMFMSAAQHGPGSWRKSHFAGSRIARSRDGGKTWQVLTNGLPFRLQPSIEALCLEDSGTTFSLFAGTTAGDVWWSEDGGATWSQAVSGLGAVSKGGHHRNLAVAAAA